MKCIDCKYQKFIRRNNAISTGHKCTHPDIEDSAIKYEKQHKRITKSVDFIGRELPKTCLRWCPLKEGSE